MKSFLVIGLSRFGRNLAYKLIELGNEVMVIDIDEDLVSRFGHIATATYVGDCQNEEVLRSLGVSNFDVCFVCISDDFQGSLEITLSLKDLGAKYVVARADRGRQRKFLKKIGADHVINSEKDMAMRVATRYSFDNVFDYFELSAEYAIYEICTPKTWVGKTAQEANIRGEYNINIIALKIGDAIIPFLSPDYRFQEGDHLIIASSKDASARLSQI